MADNPYIGLPHRALWSRGVARRYDASDVVTSDGPLLRAGDRVASMGSCFASNIVPHIEAAGVTYLRMEEPPPQVAMLPENLGYRNFSAAYGNVYTAAGRALHRSIPSAGGPLARTRQDNRPLPPRAGIPRCQRRRV